MATTGDVRVAVRVDPSQALDAIRQVQAAAAAVRTELAPAPGFQTSEGKLTALRQAAYAILAVLGLFGVHVGASAGQIDKWLPIAAFVASVVDGAIYTWHRSRLKAAVAASTAAVIAPTTAVVEPIVVEQPVVVDENAGGAADDPDPPRARAKRPQTEAQSAARARRAASEAAAKRRKLATAPRKR